MQEDITTFPELNEQFKVSLCSIFHVQGYCGPAWTHTVLVLSASQLTQPWLFPSSWGPSDICQSQVVPPSINPRPFILTKLGFFHENARWPVSMATALVCRVGRERFFFLRIDGDDFTATAPHQEDPVQTLEENLQELHVWEESSQGRNTERH